MRLKVILVALTCFLRFNKEVHCIQFEFPGRIVSIVSESSVSKSIERVKNATAFSARQCDSQVLAFLVGLSSKLDWAISMYESSGVTPAGFRSGNLYNFGHFDQCYKINVSTSDVGLVRGQYCLGNAYHVEGGYIENEYHPLYIGYCLPAVCEPSIFERYLNDFMLDQGNPMLVTIDPKTCYIHNPIELDTLDAVAIALLFLVAKLILLSTSYDIITRLRANHRRKSLLAFSAYSNLKNLFSFQNSKSPDMINCLNGIRALSIVWVVLCHAFNWRMEVATYNSYDIWNKVQKNIFMYLLLYGDVAVDSFLLLSAILVTWNIMKMLDERKTINVPMMYLHRYMRLTPSYAMVILLTMSLVRYIGNGPNDANVYDLMITDSCYEYWWSALLYIQNYVNPSRICGAHTWYLSVDFQLFLIAPLIIYPLWKWHSKAMGLVIVLLVVSTASCFGIYYAHNFQLRSPGHIDLDYNSKVYYPTHIRARSWLVGIVYGYALHRLKFKKCSLPKALVASCWIVSLTILLAVIFGPYKINNAEENSLLAATFHETFSRIGWNIALGWIVFACVKGYGGFINLFLSHVIWQPVARLSYMIYILHVPIQYLIIRRMRHPNFFNSFALTHQFWGDFGFTLTTAILFHIAFEAPVLHLQAVLSNAGKPKATKRKPPVMEPRIKTTAVNGNIAPKEGDASFSA